MKTKAEQIGINNNWLKAQGLWSVKRALGKVPLSKWQMNSRQVIEIGLTKRG